MKEMFDGASSFNQDLSSWDVSKVKSLKATFEGASVFDKPIRKLGHVSKVTDMSYMLSKGLSVVSINPSDSWDTSAVTEMKEMFYAATSFNSPLCNWNVKSVIDMERMFAEASSFSQPLCAWYEHTPAYNAISGYSSEAFVCHCKFTDMFRNAAAFLENFANADDPDTTDGPGTSWVPRSGSSCPTCEMLASAIRRRRKLFPLPMP